MAKKPKNKTNGKRGLLKAIPKKKATGDSTKKNKSKRANTPLPKNVGRPKQIRKRASVQTSSRSRVSQSDRLKAIRANLAKFEQVQKQERVLSKKYKAQSKKAKKPKLKKQAPRDHNGKFISKSYFDKVKAFRAILIKEGKLPKNATYARVTKGIENNEWTNMRDSAEYPRYFEVLSNVLTFLDDLKDKKNKIIIRIKPFQRGERLFSMSYAKRLDKNRLNEKDYTREGLTEVDKNLVFIIDTMSTLIKDTEIRYRKDFNISTKAKFYAVKVYFVLWENSFTGEKFMLDINYDKLDFSGTNVAKGKFLAIMDELSETGKYL